MSENNEQPAKKTDWSFVESVRATDNPGGLSRGVIRPPASADIVPVDGSNVPAAPVVSIPDSKPGLGILAQWRANTISRKSALQELQATYDAQLDILKHRLEKAVTMKNAQADVIATEYLKQLDAQQLDILTKLDLKNKATRERCTVRPHGDDRRQTQGGAEHRLAARTQGGYGGPAIHPPHPLRGGNDERAGDVTLRDGHPMHTRPRCVPYPGFGGVPLQRYRGGAEVKRPRMTEEEWRQSTDHGDLLLEALAPYTSASEVAFRKFRLLACACCRRMLSCLHGSAVAQLVEAAERYAEGLAGREELSVARGLMAGLVAEREGEVFAGRAILAATDVPEDMDGPMVRTTQSYHGAVCALDAVAELLHTYELPECFDWPRDLPCELVRDAFAFPWRASFLDACARRPSSVWPEPLTMNGNCSVGNWNGTALPCCPTPWRRPESPVEMRITFGGLGRISRLLGGGRDPRPELSTRPGFRWSGLDGCGDLARQDRPVEGDDTRCSGSTMNTILAPRWPDDVFPVSLRRLVQERGDPRVNIGSC